MVWRETDSRTRLYLARYHRRVPRLPDAPQMSEVTARTLLTICASLFFALIWGLMSGGRSGGLTGVCSGVAVGVLLCPIAIYVLRRRRLTHGMSIWLGSTTLVTIIIALLDTQPEFRLLAIAGTYLGSIALVMLVVPKIIEVIPGHCANCGYNLSGIKAACCPECGHSNPD